MECRLTKSAAGYVSNLSSHSSNQLLSFYVNLWNISMGCVFTVRPVSKCIVRPWLHHPPGSNGIAHMSCTYTMPLKWHRKKISHFVHMFMFFIAASLSSCFKDDNETPSAPSPRACDVTMTSSHYAYNVTTPNDTSCKIPKPGKSL